MARYLHKAITRAELQLDCYYSIDDLTKALLETGEIPVKAATLQRNLRNYVGRNVHQPNKIRVKGKYLYLGAALRLPVPHLYPETMGQVGAIKKRLELKPVREPVQTEIDEGENMSEQPSKKSKKMKIFSAALMVTLFIAVTSGWGTTQFLKYVRSGPSAIADDLERSKHLSYEEMYYLAEARFDAGEFDEAARHAYELLSMRRIPPHFAGHAHFVIAKVESRKGRYQSALGQANLAKSIYENLPDSKPGSLRGVETLASTILIQTEEYEMALSRLLPLFVIEKTSSYKAYIALLCSEASFWLGNYGDALDWNEKAFGEYENANDQMGLTNALVNRSWLRVVIGELVLAASDLEKAEFLINQLGNSSMSSHTSLTQTFLDKCLGKPVSLVNYREIKDPHFLKYVDFVESHSCIPFRIVSHNPPPQGGNDPPPISEQTGDNSSRMGAETPPPQGGNDPPPKKHQNNN